MFPIIVTSLDSTGNKHGVYLYSITIYHWICQLNGYCWVILLLLVFDNYCLVITYVTKHAKLHVFNLLLTYCHALTVEKLQILQYLGSINILHVFNHLVSVRKLRVIGHLVSVTKLHVFNHLESVRKLHVFNHLASVAMQQVFYYLVSDAKLFDIIYQLSPLLESDPTVCLPSKS